MGCAIDRRTFVVSTATALAVSWCARTSLADVGGAEQAAKRGRVIKSCTKNWAENKGDCSAFVKAVTNDLNLGVTLNGQANAICDQMSKAPWVPIGTGDHAAEIAGVTAGEGKFVVAGLRAA